MAKNVAKIVEEFSLPVARELGLDIWDVEFVKEGADYYLRVYIDKEPFVTTEDCEKFSRALDPVLDREDPIEQSYCFEVSSPGVERVLSRPEHFEKYTGADVKVSLYRGVDGKKEYVGKLICGGDPVVIEVDGNRIEFEKKNCAKVRLNAF